MNCTWISASLFFVFFAAAAYSSSVEEAVLPMETPVVEEAAIVEELPLASPITVHDELMKINSKDGYTINYNTLSIIEYIRFASKICGVNFIFNETDLNFNVTVVSEGPMTSKNVMATLVQLLRIHGLSLLEQDNNLVIHKNPDVKQIAKLMLHNRGEGNSPIVTRLFRVKMLKPESVAAIIRPMISKESILDVSPETKQLILTDVTANVEKVALLIENLDMPYANIETQTYETKHNSAEFLIGLATQILDPIVRGSPFIMVPQPLARTIYIVSTPDLNEKAVAVLKRLDIVPKKGDLGRHGFKADNVYVYKIEHATGESVVQGLRDIASSLRHAGVLDFDLIESLNQAKLVHETNSILFIASKESIEKLKEFLPALDVAPKQGAVLSSAFFIFRPQHRSPKEVQMAIHEMAKNLKGTKGVNPALLHTMESAKVNPLTNTLFFSGEESTFGRVKELLLTIDTSDGSSKAIGQEQFFLYQIQQASPHDIEASLKHFAADLKKAHIDADGLVETIENMQLISESHSLLFTGSDAALKRVQEILPLLDKGVQVSAPVSSQFFIYKPVHQSGEQLISSLKEMEHNLQSGHLADPGLLRSLQSVKWIPSTHSLLFTGDAPSLKRVEEVLTTLDVSAASVKRVGYYVYKLQNTTTSVLEESLKNLVDNLKQSGAADPKLLHTLESIRYIQGTNSALLTGSVDTLEEVKQLIANYDISSAYAASGYFLYRLQNTTGDLVEEDLENLANNLKKSGMIDTKLIQVIDSMRYVKETNSILLTGDVKAIEEAKDLLAKYDYPRPAAAVLARNQFYLYKPQNLDAAKIQKALRDIGENLKNSQLADSNFLSTIESMKYVDSTNSIIFTGTEEALQKIQTLIKDVDVASQKTIQHLGKTTFFLYKLQFASGDQIVSAINKIVADLKKSGTSETDFVAALASMQYISETNSVMFTGPEDALAKVQKLVEKFDTASSCSAEAQESGVCCAGPSQFYLYSLLYVKGPDLIKLLEDFAEGVKSSGLCDTDLFNTISSARWVEKTHSLVFTGTEKSLTQLKELLKTFDIPQNLAPSETIGGDNPIEGIENTSFLVYKLQFHKGDEIQGALRQIAKDLTITSAAVNQNLLNAINSIQWLEVTNSLLSSGDQETLVRLRELIKSLDIPLKQVFIEMLVIQTSLINSLSFGLEWGGKYKYRDKFSGSINNPIPSSASPAVLDSFSQGLNNINPGGTMPTATTTGTTNAATSTIPVPQLIPFSPTGFDLGIIGEVIRHNGQTFLTLGSLLNALQTESETAIVMNPKVIAQDSKTSSYFVGQNIPFTGSFVSNTSTNTVNTTNIEYRDIGMSLTITPVLGNSDIVTLDIAFDQSSTVGNTQNQVTTLSNGTTTLQGITTTKTTMQTTVHVPDNNFLILSGQIQTTKEKTSTGLPCLGGLPLIGAAFSTETSLDNNSNVVIFIRPHILDSLDDMKKISKAQEEFFRDQAGSPYLEHGFDEGMEMIKTVDDE